MSPLIFSVSAKIISRVFNTRKYIFVNAVADFPLSGKENGGRRKRPPLRYYGVSPAGFNRR
ncbi:hypothetical protein [Cloacibacillus porcorum]|uniref:hypothetical protein n=1 Tax=Cloacibacillus porcorum TaxID=1197717 RepID=UPI0023F28D23|nr:hypothetical protein [Cloacibacillus porcorum]MDD7650872.1 hypothetical protein [Cloacibacillus porcorum]MDY4094202.1 hypothetical protein [Cloacibacillus porcorum]